MWKYAKKVSYRVPKCLNNFKNNPGLRYYRIPENPTSNKEYKRLVRNETLKINSDNIRILILNLEFHKAAVSGHYCFLSMLTNFKIVVSHLPNPHCYADDTQLYIAFRPGNDLEETSAITAMESCIAGISQCLLTGMRQQIQKVSNISTNCSMLSAFYYLYDA